MYPSAIEEKAALLDPSDSQPSPNLSRNLQTPRFNNPLLDLPMLSPLLPRTPYSGRHLANDFSRFSYEKRPEDPAINESTLEKGVLERYHNVSTNPSNPKIPDDDQWHDPGRGLGKMTLVWLVAAAVGLLGFFLFMGRMIDGIYMPSVSEHSLHHHPYLSAEVPSEAFAFPPSHYLKDCAAQIQDQSDSTLILNPLTNQSDQALDTFFSKSQSQEAVENEKLFSEEDEAGNPICQKTLTYLLDDDFGFSFHLNAISLAAALAEKDSRAFFIIDSNWDRGTWSDHFIKTSDPGCAPPPPSEMAGCPRSTRHWILTSSIFAPHFSKEFDLNYEDVDQVDEKTTKPAGIIPYKRRSIYEMARSTFLRFFILTDEDDQLIHQTKQDIIKSAIWGSTVDDRLPPFISVHIRKGDRHPLDPRHKFDYIPITEFVDSINSTWSRLRDADPNLPDSPNVYLASDTPLVLEQMRAITPSDWNFFHLSEAKSQNLSQIAHPHEYSQRHFHAHVLSERLGYTRGQIIDMAFLGGGWPKPDGTVRMSSTDFDKPLASICTTSSNMCQFGALQLGWSEAFENNKWINLDLPLSASWKGIEIPAPNSGDSNPDGHGHGGAHHAGGHHA